MAELGGPDGLALPDEVVACLERMRAAGLSERVVAIERNSWLVLSAHAPDQVPADRTRVSAGRFNPTLTA